MACGERLRTPAAACLSGLDGCERVAIGRLAQAAAQNRAVPDLGGNSRKAGNYELANVRISGLPVTSVAVPTLSDEPQDRLTASKRVEVIEGNLRQLYDPVPVCSASELLSERLVGLARPWSSMHCPRELAWRQHHIVDRLKARVQ